MFRAIPASEPLIARAAVRLVRSTNYIIKNHMITLLVTSFLLLVSRHFFFPNWDDVLLTAASTGDLESALKAIKRRANINVVRRADGATPLLIACQNGHSIVMMLLLSMGARLNDKDNSGVCALYAACKRGDFAVAGNLLAKGADPNSVDKEGRSPLLAACCGGHYKIMMLLFGRGASIRWRALNGWNALLSAINRENMSSSRCVNIAEELLVRGMNLESKTQSGWTAVIRAASEGMLQVLVLLLQHGADIDARASNGFTALIAACQNGHYDCALELIECGAAIDATLNDGSTALIAGCSGGHLELVRLLLSRGAVPDALYKNGSTALMMAASIGHIEMMSALLEHGADVNRCNADGWTALQTSINCDAFEAAKELLRRGADPNRIDSKGWTCLMRAAEKGHLELCELLIATGADISAELGNWNVLAVAVCAHKEAVVELLIRHGATVKRDSSKSAPLPFSTADDVINSNPMIVAAQTGNAPMLELLLQAGGDANTTVRFADRDRSCLSVALESGSYMCVDVLLRHGAHPEMSFTLLAARARVFLTSRKS